jgi:hypothetical protein
MAREKNFGEVDRNMKVDIKMEIRKVMVSKNCKLILMFFLDRMGTDLMDIGRREYVW